MFHGYGNGGDEREMAELNRLNTEVLADPDNYEHWEKLLGAASTLEGGLGRNSNPQAIEAARDCFDRFLGRYPLFFGYWKKYADLEFTIAGSESAEYIYERAVASVASVDLWVHYCTFKIETCHDPELIRGIFDRATDSVGLDFLAHPLWDKYLDFEKSQNEDHRIFVILGKVIHSPLHAYARYFEHYRAVAASRPLSELGPEQLINEMVADSQHLAQMKGGDAGAIERDVRHRLDAHHMEIFNRTQAETTKRWTFESEIKRPYFHLTELDESQLSNWTRYLDFEESQGNYERIAFLYERCLVPCAHYDQFWQRYARWMYSQPQRAEELRCIFARASCIYAPIAYPKIRMQWAMFEESQGRPDVAAAIYEAIVMAMPDHKDAIVRLANLQLRHHGSDAALAVYSGYITSDQIPNTVRGSIALNAAQLIYTSADTPAGSKSGAEQARAFLESHSQTLHDSAPFWRAWLEFEAGLPANSPTARAKLLTKVKGVYMQIQDPSVARLPPDSAAELSRVYLDFLAARGGSHAAREWVELDALVDGSAAVTHSLKQRASYSKGSAAALVERQASGGMNGH